MNVETDGKRYLKNDGTFQGGYFCSIRSVTEWEDYRSGYLFEHPNYFRNTWINNLKVIKHQYALVRYGVAANVS